MVGGKGYPAVTFPFITDTLINNALRTIRTMESRGNYTIASKYSSASGAYQFLDTTWGNFGGYKRAKDAPPATQDARAKVDVLRVLKNHGGDFKWIPAVWYVGNRGATTMDWDKVAAPEAGNKSTVKQYVDKWLAEFKKGLPK